MTTLLINGTEQPTSLIAQYRELLQHRYDCELAERLAKLDADCARDQVELYRERLGIGRRLELAA